jgi:hypothetical protein
MTDIREIRNDDKAYDSTDVRGLPCQRPGCREVIRFPVTYQGLGAFCSHRCAELAVSIANTKKGASCGQ